MARIVEKTRDRADEYYDRVAAQARLKHYNRWLKMSGGVEIDYNNPRVELEFYLCDPRNLALIKKGKKRDDFLAKLSPEAARLYLEDVDEDGAKYTDLEHPRVMASITKSIVAKARGR